MCSCLHPCRCFGRWLAVTLFFGAATAYGVDMDQVETLLGEGKYREAIDLLVKEAEENPAHEAARILLAEAYDKAGMSTEAISAWQDVMALSRDEDNLRKGRRALSRLRRIRLDELDASTPKGAERPADPFNIRMPETDWKVVTTMRRIPAARCSGASATTIWMVLQFGLLIRPWWARRASALTSGTTSGTRSSIRKSSPLSITTQPRRAASQP